MAYARAKKHYRAVQKQLEMSPKKGIFIPKKKKNLLICISVAVVLVAFIKGLLCGYILGRND